MELTLETYRKTDPHNGSDALGTSSMMIADNLYRTLETLEKQLQQSGREDLHYEVDPAVIALRTPAECGDVENCKLRLFIDPATGNGQFHLVANERGGQTLYYTESAMVRMVAL
ncbi:hypothetical protein NOR51B_1587 [Luminiphilus syltensis NOR5-1B]|uniref:Uncharacterized protein n=1 Tax=Luminiphilus syltensis NOR5-1B TaxID=565045 RepID=B8KTV3_9GAMM|nr:hypothetical protein [Luminiphilus syltensis]EED35640.1 hypothetical protein NOR51B_1587 [Luminiphilus syltensis NOR5-1B]